MATETNIRKYIFKQKLAGEPVCIVWSIKNGFHADTLEEYGIWEPSISSDVNNICWTINYPLSIIYDSTRHEMKRGDTFRLD